MGMAGIANCYCEYYWYSKFNQKMIRRLRFNENDCTIIKMYTHIFRLHLDLETDGASECVHSHS